MAPCNDLINDVILGILTASDVPSVLALSQTCKSFHQLAFSHCVWVALLLDINCRIKFELPPGRSINTLSTQSLVDLAKRTILGPKSWSRLSPSYSKPVISRELTLRLDTPLDIGEDYGAYVVPGGEYIILGISKLQCWKLSTNQHLWTHEPQGDPDWGGVRNFAVEMVDGDKAMILLICMRNSYPGSPDRRNAVEIVYLDLATLKSRLLLSLNAQDTLHDNDLFQPRLSGDLAAVGVNGEDSIEVIVMNWKTKSFFPLPMPHSEFDLGIIPGYFIVYSRCGTVQCPSLHLSIYDSTSFSPYWFTDLGLSHIGMIVPLKIAPIWAQANSLAQSHILGTLQLSAHIHQFYPRCYTLWVARSSSESESSPYSSTIERYTIDLGSENGISIERKGSVTLDQGHRCFKEGGISSTGHALWSDGNRADRIIPVAEQKHAPNESTEHKGKQSRVFDNQVSIQAERIYYQITPHSGAITSLSRRRDILYIDYYE